jgi:adenylate cyclase class 2
MSNQAGFRSGKSTLEQPKRPVPFVQPDTAWRRNVEMKARCSDLLRALEQVRTLAPTSTLSRLPDEHQVDTYFRVPYGRLKLREIAQQNAPSDPFAAPSMTAGSARFEECSACQHPWQPSSAQLIWYDRPDERACKTSCYQLVEIAEPKTLRTILQAACGILVEVVKHRTIFLLGPIRIHLDQVGSLGTFLEFEVVLAPEAATQDGETHIRQLREHFAIADRDLLDRSYSDMLLERESG